MRVPEVPTYQSHILPTSAQQPEIPIGLGGIVPNAIGKVAGSAFDLSNEFIKIQERQKLEQGERDVVKSMSSISDEMRNFLTIVKDNPNSEVHQDTIKFTEGVKAQYMPKSSDQRVIGYYDKMFESHRKAALDSSAMIQAQYIHNDKIDTSNSAVASGEKNAIAMANDPEKLNVIIDNIRNIVRTTHPNGKDELFVSKTMEGVIGNVISNLTPSDPLLAKKYAELYKRELPDIYDNLTLHIDNLIKVKDNDIKVSTAFQTILNDPKVTDRKTGKINYNMGQTLAITGDAVKGLNLDQQRSLATQFGVLESANKDAMKIEYHKVTAPIVQDIIAGDWRSAQKIVSVLSADPKWYDYSGELKGLAGTIRSYQTSEANQAKSLSMQRKAQEQADAQAQMEALVRLQKFSNTTDPQQGNNDLVAAASKIGLDRKYLPTLLALNNEVMKSNGMMNYYTQVYDTLKKASTVGNPTYIEAIAKNQSGIVNSLSYYMNGHADELDKSFGKERISVYNPKVIDVYNKIIEKADKKSFFSYDFSDVLKIQNNSFANPPPSSPVIPTKPKNTPKPFNVPKGYTKAPDGNYYKLDPNPKRKGKFLKWEQ